MKQLIIVGAGGLGREAFQYALDTSAADRTFEAHGFLDDNPSALAGDAFDGRIVGGTHAFAATLQHRFLIAVGDPALRRTLAERILAWGGQFATVQHPLCYVAPTASIGQGCMLAPYAFVGPGARLEPHTVLNTHVSVGHDAMLAAYCVLSPLCVIGGGTRLGQSVFMGSSSTVLPRKTIGRGSKIAAGAVVMQDVPDGALAAGNPAKARVMFAP